MNCRTSGIVAAIERRGVAASEDAALVQEHQLVADGPRARNVVGHDDQRGPGSSLELHQERVDFAGGDRIEAGARLVRQQDRRVERQRARQPGALPHAAREVRRHLVVLALEPDLREQVLRARADLVVRQCGVPAQRERHVLADRDRVEQRGVLEEKPDALAHSRERRAPFSRRDVLAFDQHLPRVGRIRPTMCLSVTLLPVPLRPRMQTPRPAGIVRHTSSSTRSVAKGLGDMTQLDGGRGLAHPGGGNKKKIKRTSSTLATISRIDDITTLRGRRPGRRLRCRRWC